MYAPPLRYKREALAAHKRTLEAKGSQTQHKLGFTPNNPVLNLLRAQAIQHTMDVGYYAPAARTTLNLLCSSCSSTKIGLILANPRVLTLWVYAGALRHPAVGLHTTHILFKI